MTIIATVSTLIFVIALVLIFSERINRTIVAFAGAFLMMVAGVGFGFYDLEHAIASIDFETLGLLLGMMIIVAMLEPTGFFEYLAVLAARASRGDPVRLFVLLGTVTTVLSMFLDNVTTVVLIAPVTLLISEILGVSAIPYLVAEALLSNTGGVATLVGDPPNILIGSAANLSFNDFLTNSLPIVFVTWFAALYLLRYLFRAELSVPPRNAEAVMRLNPGQSLNQPGTAKKILIVLGLAIVMFFVHHILHVEPAFVALGAAAIALIWVQPEIEETLERVEWNVLIFFGSLFVMVGGLVASGVMDVLISFLEGASAIPLIWFGVILIWVVALLSAIVGNIPITVLLIPVIQGLAQDTGLNITPLWWALVFGAGFGGNGTIFGSAANVVVVSLSDKTRTPITAAFWLRRGLPVMLVTCTIASILYTLFYNWF
ncbi:MAG TPA: citrate transporter [Anaerolineae bacterium]|nr:citrate transporter [Anaerolineae bacterium]